MDLAQDARDALNKEGQTLSTAAYTTKVVTRTRSAFINTAQFIMTPAELRLYQQAIGSTSITDMQGYFARRFDLLYVKMI